MSLDRKLKMSPSFRLGELIPADCKFVPADILVELQELCQTILEPVRTHFGVPVAIHDAWRPLEHNEAVGGVPTSDHLTGHAADFHVLQGNGQTWEQNTLDAYDFIRQDLDGKFGQLILEDHRTFANESSKLWIHVSTPTAKHPGVSTDFNAVLISDRPGHYLPFQENRA